ncbi:MAG: DUF4387 domain-containing protein [Planctomycetota bacterium]|jgi:hypothetical protein
MKKITEIAKVIRSKNSSPFDLTLDIIMKSAEYYDKLKSANAVTRELIAEIYNIDLNMVGEVIWFDPASAIKIGIRRKTSSGAPGDTDVYGAQQHAPLLGLEFDI